MSSFVPPDMKDGIRGQTERPQDQVTTELLRRAREGSQADISEVCRRAGPRLLPLVRLRLGPSLRRELDSQDIVQATLLKACQRLADVEGQDAGALWAWLCRIAENEVRDRADAQHRQKRDARRDVPADARHEELAAHARSAVSLVILDEAARRLERALDTLPADQREVVLLRRYEELPFAEVGRRMGRTEDACRMLLARAMAALTLAMDDEP